MKKSILIFLFITLVSFYSKGQNQSISLDNYFGYNPSGENFFYQGTYLGHYSIGWYSFESSAEARLSGFGGIKLFTAGTPRFTITGIGNVGIGVTNPTYKLEVNGSIKTKEVNVTLAGWPDYVFRSGYNLRSLSEVENYIVNHGHLPNIPSEKEVLKNGLSLGEINVKLLEKIEELTLYLIHQNKTIEELTKQKNTLEELLRRVEQLERENAEND